MVVGNDSSIGRGLVATWPHQVLVGNRCHIEHSVYFKFDGIWQVGPRICIGNDTFIGTGCEFNIRRGITVHDDVLIASGCRFIDHDHGIAAGTLIRLQPGPEAEIVVGRGAWIGCNCVVLKGVTIGEGAVIGAGSVVNRSVPPNEIWAGVPAKAVGNRIYRDSRLESAEEATLAPSSLDGCRQ